MRKRSAEEVAYNVWWHLASDMAVVDGAEHPYDQETHFLVAKITRMQDGSFTVEGVS